MKALHELGADVNVVDSDLNSAAHLVMYSNDSERAAMIQFLVKVRSSVKRVNAQAKTPLHLAAAACDVPTVAILLNAGVPVDKGLETPLHLLCRRKAVARICSMESLQQCLMLLLRHGAPVCAVDDRGDIPMCRTIIAGTGPMTRMLIANGGLSLFRPSNTVADSLVLGKVQLTSRKRPREPIETATSRGPKVLKAVAPRPRHPMAIAIQKDSVAPIIPHVAAYDDRGELPTGTLLVACLGIAMP